MTIPFNRIIIEQSVADDPGRIWGYIVKFGVVIVTFNRLELLKECLACVMGQTVPFHVVCVVDNHSTDGTKEYLDGLAADASPVAESGAATPTLQIHHLPENIGGAGGFSFGMSKLVDTDCDWILVIDDDAMLDSHYMEKIEANIEGDTVAYSGRVETGGKIDTSHRRRISNPWLMLYEPMDEVFYTPGLTFFPYDVSTFCGLVINREIIKRVGLPKDEYFIWLDDTEYSLRLRKYSWIINVNDAVLNHKTNPGGKTPVISWKSYYGFRNAIDIGRQYAPCRPLYYGYIYLNHMTHIVIDAVLLPFSRKREMRRYRMGIYWDVIKDSRNKRLGRNEKYLPGTGREYF